MERAHWRFISCCWRAVGVGGEGGGRVEFGKRAWRRCERRGGRRVGGWKVVRMR